MKEEYNKDVEYVLQHQVSYEEAGKCEKHSSIFHKLIGCPYCGKYKELFIS